MEQALYQSNDFDVWVIDEADICLLEKGSLVDVKSQLVRGFWDLLIKRTILLTATISTDMEDILFEVYGLNK